MRKANTKKTVLARKFSLPLFSLLVSLTALFALHTTTAQNFVRVSVADGELSAFVADTDFTREKGLSSRRALGVKQGMLFVFDRPGRYGIWMKDMVFPIDIIWLDENKKVNFIKENAKPESYPETYVSEQPAQYVLEVRSGQARALKLIPGSQLNW